MLVRVYWQTADLQSRCNTFVDEASVPRDSYGRAAGMPSDWYYSNSPRKAACDFACRVPCCVLIDFTNEKG